MTNIDFVEIFFEVASLTDWRLLFSITFRRLSESEISAFLRLEIKFYQIEMRHFDFILVQKRYLTNFL